MCISPDPHLPHVVPPWPGHESPGWWRRARHEKQHDSMDAKGVKRRQRGAKIGVEETKKHVESRKNVDLTKKNIDFSARNTGISPRNTCI